MQLSELRKDLEFNTDLLSLIETLKNVAASQYHLMEKNKERFDQFMDAFSGFFQVVNLIDVKDPLVEVSSDVVGVVVVTSDSGFMGGLNRQIMLAADRIQGGLSDDKIALMIIGDKGAGAYSDRRRDFKYFPGIHQDSIYEQSVEIKDYIVQEVLAKRMGKVSIAYAMAESFSTQSVKSVDILPCAALFDEKADSEVAEHKKSKKLISDARKVVIESSFSDMLEYLSGVWVTSKLFEVFEDSKLAEFSARAMHLEGSLQKIEEEHGKVKRSVFKATHELIDKQMRESHSAKTIKEKKSMKAKKRKLADRLAAEEAKTKVA